MVAGGAVVATVLYRRIGPGATRSYQRRFGEQVVKPLLESVVAGARVDDAQGLARAELGYWRTATGEEVDFVIESDDRLLPVEVKAAARPRLGDATQLRSFRAEYGKKARAGLLLHTGSTLEWLTPDVLAVPWWRVL